MAISACLLPSRAGGQASKAWPDEPPGFRTLADQPFDSFRADGWQMAWNDSGWTTLARDSMAPFSPPGIAFIHYPAGFPGGIAPGTEYLDLQPVTTLFVGLWL